jgi:alanyl-tRNA synthetase
LTERLYYSDAYLRDFEASIVARGDDGHRIYLDRTAFYPTSGGQLFDTGELAGVPVIDVVDEGEQIAHVVAFPIDHDRVNGQVDWPRRFDHMQQHTGQHLISAVAAESLGYSTVAVHFGRESSTIDLEGAQLTNEQAAALEKSANQVVVENRLVQISFEEASEAIGLRKRTARTGPIRIITIEQLDRSACGGTHVRATGEIGTILLRKIERVRRATRLEFVCGGRAIALARADYALLTRLSAEFSAAPDEIPRLVAAQREELKEAQAARREVEGRVDLYQARELYGSATPDGRGIRSVVYRPDRGSLEMVRRIGQAFATLPLAMFVGVLVDPPSIVLSASSDSGINAAAVLKGVLTAVGGRGGGSATLAQGVVPGRPELERALAYLGGGDADHPAEAMHQRSGER